MKDGTKEKQKKDARTILIWCKLLINKQHHRMIVFIVSLCGVPSFFRFIFFGKEAILTRFKYDWKCFNIFYFFIFGFRFFFFKSFDILNWTLSVTKKASFFVQLTSTTEQIKTDNSFLSKCLNIRLSQSAHKIGCQY